MMPSYSRFKEKIDVLDLIIEVLRDHEETLSGLVERFEEISGKMAVLDENINLLGSILERLGELRVKDIVKASGINGPLTRIECNDWETFRSSSQGALIVTFEFSGGEVIVSSVTDLFIFTFSGGLLEFMGELSKAKVNWRGRAYKAIGDIPPHMEDDYYEATVDPEVFRRFLSFELGMPEEKIIRGRVLH